MVNSVSESQDNIVNRQKRTCVTWFLLLDFCTTLNNPSVKMTSTADTGMLIQSKSRPSRFSNIIIYRKLRVELNMMTYELLPSWHMSRKKCNLAITGQRSRLVMGGTDSQVLPVPVFRLYNNS